MSLPRCFPRVPHRRPERRGSVVLRRLGHGLLLTGTCAALTACGTLHMPHLWPFGKSETKTVDTGPARASAENMVRLDAVTRSGCDEVNNIERPPVPPTPPGTNATASQDDAGTQRWIARTCNGDIAYDVVIEQGRRGPTVRVTPVDGPINRPMNSHFLPAMPEGATGAPSSETTAPAGTPSK